ncbi:regulatory sensor-transducer, BlaR1/MecR1 family protein [Flavobacterium sp. CHNK8]|nr:regulatory sensor-transducer, BlaR1/MecR1 family protein [Flavobacterium sp. CHNK8]
MHRFNRFYLLFALVFSMVIPFITIEVVQEIAQPAVTPGNIQMLPATTVVVDETNYFAIALWSLYGFVTVVLGFRFMCNVMQISKKMKSTTAIAYQNAQLVLVPEKTLPHTFLNTIFINESEYNNRQVEAELYTHELTHVTQKHTLDILFIEVLKTVFWFNPIFIFYKKAIQLNHEFLADEKVVHSYNNVPFYQSLLLSKANANPTFYLASNLNYLITKKRLLMMTKTTSNSKSIAKKMILIPIFTGLVNLMCIQTIAQTSTNNNATVQSEIKKRDVYYKGVRLIVKDDTKKVLLDKKYEALTPNEKRFYISNVPPETSMKKPTQKEFDSWTKDSKFSGLFKGKKLNNIDLKKHSIQEIAGYIRFYKPSMNGKPYDIDLNHYALFTNSEREMITKKSRKSISFKVIEKTIKAGTFSNPILIKEVQRNI